MLQYIGENIMNFRYIVAAAGLVAGLSSCATNYTYQPIIPNPPNMEMTQARCQMLSGSVDQGYLAYGSTSYVAGAAIGNALGNAIREDQFIQQCMTMSGWRRVPLQPQSASAMPAQQPKYSPLTGKPVKGAGKFPPAPG
jgi:hypothetical protein